MAVKKPASGLPRFLLTKVGIGASAAATLAATWNGIAATNAPAAEEPPADPPAEAAAAVVLPGFSSPQTDAATQGPAPQAPVIVVQRQPVYYIIEYVTAPGAAAPGTAGSAAPASPAQSPADSSPAPAASPVPAAGDTGSAPSPAPALPAPPPAPVATPPPSLPAPAPAAPPAVAQPAPAAPPQQPTQAAKPKKSKGS